MIISEIDNIEMEAEKSIFRIVSDLTANSSEEEFKLILLQRRWISYQFTPLYDLGNDLLSDQAESSKIVLRKIIREEYPDDRGCAKTPSHREDLIADLKGVGIEDSLIRRSRPSGLTAEAIRDAYVLIENYGDSPLADVIITAFLRFWGEVITAIEYEALWPRIKRLLNGKESVFYKYHMAHDKRACLISKVVSDMHASSHADSLGRVLVKMLPAEDRERDFALDQIAATTSHALKNKEKFYMQFSACRLG